MTGPGRWSSSGPTEQSVGLVRMDPRRAGGVRASRIDDIEARGRAPVRGAAIGVVAGIGGDAPEGGPHTAEVDGLIDAPRADRDPVVAVAAQLRLIVTVGPMGVLNANRAGRSGGGSML